MAGGTCLLVISLTGILAGVLSGWAVYDLERKRKTQMETAETERGHRTEKDHML